MKVEITKLYLIQVLDEDGNELDCAYEVCDRATALEIGRQMKTRMEQEEE